MLDTAETPLDRLLYSKCLDRKAELLSHDSSSTEGIKNLCTKVPAALVLEIDNLCESLGIKKRDFCEAAFREAVARSHQIIEETGLTDALDIDLEIRTEQIYEKQEDLPL